jgi:RimJ/RimL family protein N-acetyltransferase
MHPAAPTHERRLLAQPADLHHALPTLKLINIDDSLVQAFAENRGAEYLGAELHESLEAIKDVLDQTMSMLRSVPRSDPWGCYLAVDRATNVVIGTCGFKSGPTAQHEIELAYFTYPAFEGKGYATAMATALIAIAVASTQVRALAAHTLPAANASTRVLQKVGLKFIAEIMDPEDGKVWRWERVLAAS